MEADAHAKDVNKRMRQLRTVCDLLREQLSSTSRGRASHGASSSSGGASSSGSSNVTAAGGALSDQEVLRAAGYIRKLTAALDHSLEKQQAATAAHAECIARDLRAAEKLNDCVGALMSAGALADGLASTKPYHRQPQTIRL